MKITKKYLKNIIREELQKLFFVLKEGDTEELKAQIKSLEDRVNKEKDPTRKERLQKMLTDARKECGEACRTDYPPPTASEGRIQ